MLGFLCVGLGSGEATGAAGTLTDCPRVDRTTGITATFGTTTGGLERGGKSFVSSGQMTGPVADGTGAVG